MFCVGVQIAFRKCSKCWSRLSGANSPNLPSGFRRSRVASLFDACSKLATSSTPATAVLPPPPVLALWDDVLFFCQPHSIINQKWRAVVQMTYSGCFSVVLGMPLVLNQKSRGYSCSHAQAMPEDAWLMCPCLSCLFLIYNSWSFPNIAENCMLWPV